MIDVERFISQHRIRRLLHESEDSPTNLNGCLVVLNLVIAVQQNQCAELRLVVIDQEIVVLVSKEGMNSRYANVRNTKITLVTSA